MIIVFLLFSATFLGSAQKDVRVEAEVIQGKYQFVYLSPEKFVGSFAESVL